MEKLIIMISSTTRSLLLSRGSRLFLSRLSSSGDKGKHPQDEYCPDDDYDKVPRKFWEHSIGKEGNTNYLDTYKQTFDDFKDQGLLTHVDDAGKANMVDVGAKDKTLRVAKAVATVDVGEEVYQHIENNSVIKGDVLSVAQLAGVMAAKKTSDMIPLCHTLALTQVHVNCSLQDGYKVHVECTAKCISRTGVEMEALMGASVAALTVYDMCKAVNKSIVINDIRLMEKIGGKSGHFLARIPKLES